MVVRLVIEPVEVTTSVGISEAMIKDADLNTMMTEADRALYASKSNGRNSVSKFPVEETGKQRKNWLIYRKD